MMKKTGKPVKRPTTARPTEKAPPLPREPVRWHILPIPAILAAVAWLFRRRRWTTIPWRRKRDQSA